MLPTARTHDLLYLDEERYDDVKETFKFSLSEALAFAERRPKRILDVGCAAGEFAHYLRRMLPDARILGIDVIPALLEKARARVPDARFEIGSVLDRSAVASEHDMVFLVGVHSIFDEIEQWLSNLLHWCAPGGTVVVFGLINTSPIDTFVRVRPTDAAVDHREPGWNQFSRATFERVLSGMPQAGSFSFTDFEIAIDVAPNPDDALRSWTEVRADGTRLIINGTGLVHDFKALCIRKAIGS